MQQYKILVLTDHTNHSEHNSLYALAVAMSLHPRCAQLDVATRGEAANASFFAGEQARELSVSPVEKNFAFSPNGSFFKQNLRREFLTTYDAIWLRLPPPLSEDFLNFLIQKFPQQLIINDPKGIQLTGSKGFLMRFPDLSAPMKICESIADIIAFKNRFPIVLKPFREYGGKGIIRIDGDRVWEGKEEYTFAELVQRMEGRKIEYLGVKFLKNVSQGDKRIVVVNGKIMGASLRLPAKDSWLCNVAMGGSSTFALADQEEENIVEQINPTLGALGIVMYGVDTLVDDNGKRVLSEINTTSIGGLPQIANLMDRPLVEEAVDLIWNYIIEKL